MLRILNVKSQSQFYLVKHISLIHNSTKNTLKPIWADHNMSRKLQFIIINKAANLQEL